MRVDAGIACVEKRAASSPRLWLHRACAQPYINLPPYALLLP